MQLVIRANFIGLGLVNSRLTFHPIGRLWRKVIYKYDQLASLLIYNAPDGLKGSFVIHVSGSTSGPPTVTLAYGTFQGFSEGGLDKFLGIPFAQAGRFELPQTPTPFSEIQEATAFGPACPQQNFSPISVPGLSSIGSTTQVLGSMSEDCLFVNVIAPSNIPPGTRLPILFWIFGGGFEEGDTSVNDGSTVVARSIALGEPVIYVSANYRLNAFGFSASKEIKAAGIGNLGLRDQRFALQWVQTNIRLFGGDKTRVTIWGESAGAISVASHMVINGGNQEGLFHGAFMVAGATSFHLESGSPVPMTDISAGQPFFNQLVANTGCSGSPDILACLKVVPFDIFLNAVNESPNLLGFMSLQLAWLPRIDGDLIAENPQDSLVKGAFSNIPFANGDCDDEGTHYFVNFVDASQSNYYPDASDAQFAPLAVLYPSDPAVGSPFGTGDANQLTPQFKRIAAFQGDSTFQAPRRFFLRIASKRQNVWSFLFKRGKTTPFLGSFHGSDLAEFYSSSSTPDFQGTDALVNFANTGNPNNGATKNISTLIHWPMYSTNLEKPPLLTFLDPNELAITEDTFRFEPIQALIKLSRKFP
ncbi:hypothetical protein Clacol_002718 [Clathrus columnatus]|uniref:Carboxylic ester hydrolase n=1 Tax=Clathrus columnatus TaxID=1419009 RepID=A0AAV5A9B8_9AGAM|nr:hypothetical protein Clacol_002718 [Clathrus columnatus]